MTETSLHDFNLSCPLPLDDHATVQLAHGGGGRLMRSLIEGLFLPAFGDGPPRPAARQRRGGDRRRPAGLHHRHLRGPAAVLPRRRHRQAGRLRHGERPGDGRGPAAVSQRGLHPGRGPADGDAPPRGRRRWRAAAARRACGSSPATPRWSTAARATAFSSTRRASGLVPPGIDISPRRVAPGDVVLVSGDLGRHGMAVMSVREGLGFEAALESDCASLAGLVEAMLAAGGDLHCLRDLTRGGLAAALNEIALDARRGHRAGRGGHSRLRAGGRRPANCWGSIRSTWPTRAAWWPSSPAAVGRAACWKSCAVIRPRTAAAIIGRVTADAPRHGRDPQPAGRQPHRRSALRRADAADLLTGRPRES